MKIKHHIKMVAEKKKDLSIQCKLAAYRHSIWIVNLYGNSSDKKS